MACDERLALNVGSPCTPLVKAGVCDCNDKKLSKRVNQVRGVRPSHSTSSAGQPRTWGRGRRCCDLWNAGMGGKNDRTTRATGSHDTTRARSVRTGHAIE